MLKLMSLGSGSSGNCYYLWTDDFGILIDAGIGIRTIKKIFSEYNLKIGNVRAVFVTHDHADHIKAVGHLGALYHIPVYATHEVHKGIEKSYCCTKKLIPEDKKFINKNEHVRIGDFDVTCFEVPHDATDNVGYTITYNGKTLSILTDIGHITPEAELHIQSADYLIMEANYDESMLVNGPYPQCLKARIAGPNGHMANSEMANYLADNFPPNLKKLWLCHLSKDNNHPALAYKTVEMALKRNGIIVGKDLDLIALKRTTPSEIYQL